MWRGSDAESIVMKDLVILLNLLPDVSSTYVGKGGIYPATAVLLIGAMLKKHGYDVKIIDGAYDERYLDALERAVREFGPRIAYVGMSVMVTQIPLALGASRKVKAVDRAIPVVWGGPHPTLYPQQTLRNENVDVVAINEGTWTALYLAEHFNGKRDIKAIRGIGFKDEQGEPCLTEPGELESIDDLPHLDFSLINAQDYLQAGVNSVYKREFPHFSGDFRIMPILTGLGCPYQCQFCINVIFKRKYRFRPAASIIEEIKHLQREYGANTFLFFDEDFFISKQRVLELIALAEREGLKFNFRTWGRVDHFKESFISADILRQLSRIGDISIAMGGESASPQMLKAMKKGTTPEQILDSLAMITDTGVPIFPRYSFMVGLENETWEQIRTTYQFCLKMRDINPLADIAGPFFFRLYPGSPIFNRLTEKYKIRIPASLEEWAEKITVAGGFNEMPWTPGIFQRQRHLLEFYFNWAMVDADRSWRGIRSVLKFLLKKISLVRMRHFCFIFPVEYHLYASWRQLKRAA